MKKYADKIDLSRDEAERQAKLESASKFTEEAGRMFFERECRAAGINPAGGVSPSLLKTLESRNAE